jgi:hypothetical protein
LTSSLRDSSALSRASAPISGRLTPCSRAKSNAGATAKRVADFAADLRVDGDDEDLETRSAAFQRLRRELLEAEREAVLRLRSEGRIGDEVMRRVERDLDLEDSRLEI